MAIPGSPVARSRTDASTGADIGITYPHHEIHEGTMFHVSYIDTTLANSGTIEFVLTIGTPKEAHLTFGGSCGGNATIFLYENPTGVATATSMDVRNMNRIVGDSGNQVTVDRDPASIGGDGTEIDSVLIPGGTGGNATGGTSASREEWPLKPGNTYLVRLTNIAGSAKAAELAVTFYEHTPRA